MSLRNALRPGESKGAQGRGKSRKMGLRLPGRLMVGVVALSMGVAACSTGEQNNKSAAGHVSSATISASPHIASPTPPPTSPSPTAPSTKPIARETVGDHTDWNLQKAVADAHGHHVKSVAYADASELRRSVVHTSNWKVCTQTPSAGTYSTTTELAFKVVESGESCAHPPRASSGSASSSGGSHSSASSGSSSGGSTSTGGSSTKSELCSIRSNAGNCYRAGQFCRSADVGATTTDTAGRKIACGYQGSANRWHY